ncbi:beta-ketoacyl-[acyl-carrier-protein] synthase family protein [Actinorugispora endophytica]|uniref:3-oxoacyl-[acyl-carrier-protein] synthase II n=1 Tax=Actinorugispora endophytica TaxID=1605990 RepID=A0A4R6URT7_9ACTN|nr:beta-ketoacyl-[acyl-carrier-protein] synthase family protein [Actinorugispora endophytica]TDQ49990.1 3-oxoacyl-[acyl-carrier-protein] synthase II [Actinorugispora endophytica]
MVDQSVVITGRGLVTPAGIGVTENWTRLCSGESAAVPGPDLGRLGAQLQCPVPGFDADLLLGRPAARRLDRFSQLAIVAAREAVGDAGLSPDTWDGARVAVVMGCSVGGIATVTAQHVRLLDRGPEAVSPLTLPMGLGNMVAGHLAIDLRATGPNLTVSTACASGATAIGTARQMLRSGACDIAVAGGADASLDRLILSAFARMGALTKRTADPATASRPFDRDRDGFVAAEGAGVVVLEREGDARARGARVHARLAGYGASADAHHVTSPHPEGVGALAAMRAALADADAAGHDVDHVNAHGTSTKLNDLAEGRAIHALFGEEVSVTSTKGVTGHMLAAAGAAEAVYSTLSIEHRMVPPTANLEVLDPEIRVDVVASAPRAQRADMVMSTSFGFGGQNAALLVAAP